MITMLIVDDESIIREGLRDMIDWGSIGVRVVGLAADGLEGLALAGSLLPDIVLSDVIIPGMNGIEFCGRLHELRPETRIIMISAYQDADYIRAAFKFDAIDYILKPFDNDEMLSVVKKAADQIVLMRLKSAEITLMEEQIRHSLPAMRHQFFQGLLSGVAGSCADIVRQVELLGLGIPEASEFCVMQICLDPAPGHGEAARRAGFESVVRQSLQSILAQCFHIAVDDSRCVALLASPPGESCAAVAGQIRQALNDQLGMQATIGIGGAVTELGDIPKSCSQAEAACNYRLLLGRNKIIAYDDIAGAAMTEIPTDLKPVRDDIIRLAREGDTSRAVDSMHSLFSRLRGSGVADGKFIRSVCIDLHAGIAYALDTGGEDGSDILRFIRQIEPMMFIDDMEWLMEETIWARSRVEKRVSSGEASKAVRRLKEIVAERYMHALTLSGLAKEVFLTPTYVSALFKKETAQTLNDYITSVRIDRARALLMDSDMTIQLVAEAVGYQDVSYFTHLFKKHTGRTPSEYHRMRR